MRSNFVRIVGYALVVLVVMALLYSLFGYSGTAPQWVPISDVARLIDAGKVDKLEIKGSEITVITTDGKQFLARKEDNVSLKDSGIDTSRVEVEVLDDQTSALWLGVLSSFLPFLLILGFLWFMFRQAQGSGNQALSFGKSRARLQVGTKNRITFKDVAGSHEAKQELVEVVEFLKYPSKFINLGARIPKGVLLVGPPGTGKTLMARAVAGEAGVPFFNISGSEFVEMFVGVGASRVRDLFTKAKRNAPAIVFIDEIDAVGRQRGAGLGGGHDEREQTLNQILVEMDGFETDTNVIVIAATNRPDVLDPALLRPGRFDRRVTLERPDIKDREDILAVHTKNKPLDSTVDLHQVAAHTPGFSGADLQNLVNEGAILAARHNQKVITRQDLDEAVEKVLLGPERKNKILSEQEKEITAYHEAGHAVVAHILPHTDPVHKVSIVSRGMALGYTWSMPERDRHLHSKSQFMDELAHMLGGRAAEKLIFKEVTTGASNDLQRATELAREMVTRFGMSERLGPMTFGRREEMIFLGREIHEDRNYSDKIASIIDEEVSSIIDTADKRAEKVLKEYTKELRAIAAELIKKESLSRDEFESFFDE
ncbi:MAG: ATP-dependent metalloprotease FtsH, cell division protease FtsH [candidate division Kazan bacterium GW2011_GWA1_50_15]|uniref:ATP-dependent zinc metalloprotease FtsH n=2 Tax=Bacteria division Kazan-3B-28 TaxID=1798534 RepID=A0A0G1X738_UNCK3|nr:MAG: ATP-dependent metalloprotease FtsH, cell division protease FtsH [candidate division Kazan bacterium GW2011_GWA1_50_15]KKW25683.1 MAG: ATP-dependent zinc metalloprotease FtsH [candidate division Kazan bacterium GW2011_GWC1_52_13]KKW26988.1 MAG: ATP-dependent zinc metalloprotease FtsH [candidate division Kazan bacterium GW2011_GWB1_52_7]HCR42593.1 cell division protein FtsH [Patescibacteria group bacterium]